MSKQLGSMIRTLRRMGGLTQQQLADQVGLTRASITNIELGNQTISEDSINRIAYALGYEVRVRFVKLDRPAGQNYEDRN